MVSYDEYNNAKSAMKSMLKDKQELVNRLEDEMYALRKSLRILDTEFKEKIDNKEVGDSYT